MQLEKIISAAVEAALGDVEVGHDDQAIKTACDALTEVLQSGLISDDQRRHLVDTFNTLVILVNQKFQRDFAFQHAFNKNLGEYYGIAICNLVCEMAAQKTDYDAKFAAQKDDYVTKFAAQKDDFDTKFTAQKDDFDAKLSLQEGRLAALEASKK